MRSRSFSGQWTSTEHLRPLSTAEQQLQPDFPVYSADLHEDDDSTSSCHGILYREKEATLLCLSERTAKTLTSWLPSFWLKRSAKTSSLSAKVERGPCCGTVQGATKPQRYHYLHSFALPETPLEFEEPFSSLLRAREGHLYLKR